MAMEMTVARRPLSLWLLTLTGILLAIWLTVQGLHIRWFGEYLPQQSAPTLWFTDPIETHDLPIQLKASPASVAWPMLVLGLAWWGALSALWMRLSWGRPVVTVLLICSLLVPWLGTMLALVGLINQFTPSMRTWLKAS